VQSGPPLNDFGPRFGFAWQAVPKLVVRGGVGMFYDRVGGNQFVHSVEQGNPYAVTLDFSGSADQPSSLQQLLPSTPLEFVPRWANPANLTYSNLNLPFIDQVIHTPLTRQYNLNIQYELHRRCRRSLTRAFSRAGLSPGPITAPPVMRRLRAS
jgi:hypothetical protein